MIEDHGAGESESYADQLFARVVVDYEAAPASVISKPSQAAAELRCDVCGELRSCQICGMEPGTIGAHGPCCGPACNRCGSQWFAPLPVAPDPIKWWLPYACGQRVSGNGCQARGCLTCHRSKLSKFFGSVDLVPVNATEKRYAVRVSPGVGRIRTREDVAEFLKGWRALTREWRRSWGLGALWWVAECVVKREEPSTAIPCPIGQGIPASEARKLPKRARREVLSMAARHDRSCHVCRGSRFLPSVHLHIHAVVACEPFWYGAPDENPRRGLWHGFGGVGWQGFVERYGLGNTEAQELRSNAGMAAYLSKAAVVYAAKSAIVEDEARRIDWTASQRAAEIAALVYGRQRHRGTRGRCAGVRLKRSTPSSDFQFDGSQDDAAVVSPASAAASGYFDGGRARWDRKRARELSRLLSADRRSALEEQCRQRERSTAWWTPADSAEQVGQFDGPGECRPVRVELALLGKKARGDEERARQAVRTGLDRLAYWNARRAQKTRRRSWARWDRAARDDAHWRRYYRWRGVSQRDLAERVERVKDEIRRSNVAHRARAADWVAVVGAAGVEVGRFEAAADRHARDEARLRRRFDDLQRYLREHSIGVARGTRGVTRPHAAGVEVSNQRAPAVGPSASLHRGKQETEGHVVPEATQVAPTVLASGGPVRASALRAGFRIHERKDGHALRVAWVNGRPATCRPLRNLRLSPSWQGVPVVGPEDWWSCPARGGWIVGRGSASTFLADAENRQAAVETCWAAVELWAPIRRQRLQAGRRGWPPGGWPAIIRALISTGDARGDVHGDGYRPVL